MSCKGPNGVRYVSGIPVRVSTNPKGPHQPNERAVWRLGPNGEVLRVSGDSPLGPDGVKLLVTPPDHIPTAAEFGQPLPGSFTGTSSDKTSWGNQGRKAGLAMPASEEERAAMRACAEANIIDTPKVRYKPLRDKLERLGGEIPTRTTYRYNQATERWVAQVAGTLESSNSAIVGFLSGPPGTGKTALAEALADETGGQLFEFRCHEGSEITDLLHPFDTTAAVRSEGAIKRGAAWQAFEYSQGEGVLELSPDEVLVDPARAEAALAGITAAAPAEDRPGDAAAISASLESLTGAEARALLARDDLTEFQRAALTTHANTHDEGPVRSREHPAVLLIDEVDKAPPEFVNSLLRLIETGEFEVPSESASMAELGVVDGRVTADLGNLVVVFTSNSTRQMSDAFESRMTAKLQLTYPTGKEMNERVESILTKTVGDGELVDEALRPDQIALAVRLSGYLRDTVLASPEVRGDPKSLEKAYNKLPTVREVASLCRTLTTLSDQGLLTEDAVAEAVTYAFVRDGLPGLPPSLSQAQRTAFLDQVFAIRQQGGYRDRNAGSVAGHLGVELEGMDAQMRAARASTGGFNWRKAFITDSKKTKASLRGRSRGGKKA